MAPSGNTPDYARILEFCDLLNRDGTGRAMSTTATALVTIMKEETSYHVLFITLHVIERTSARPSLRGVCLAALCVIL